MGWASRAKVSAGNPGVKQGTVRYASLAACDAAVKRGEEHVRVDYSDRSYVMNTKGQLLCLPPHAQAKD